MPMFRIKICGVTCVEDAVAVARAGADAVGLNFYPASRRSVSRDVAARIVEAMPAEIVKVGLFVNAAADEVIDTFDGLGLGLIQLHGDEPPEFLASLGDRPVMRAFRVGPEGLSTAYDFLEACERLGCMPRLTLLDAYRPGTYGGTGQVADWSCLKTYSSDAPISAPPLVLAGGLTPDNVAEAIGAARPSGVDTASGVERSPGSKDPVLVRRFVESARRAFGDV
jgi:phosphoribosylanthranilate isomerase